MDVKELEKSNISASPVQIEDMTYLDGSAESSLLTTNQEKRILNSVKQHNCEMMILESVSSSPKEELKSSTNLAELSAQNAVIQI